MKVIKSNNNARNKNDNIEKRKPNKNYDKNKIKIPHYCQVLFMRYHNLYFKKNSSTFLLLLLKLGFVSVVFNKHD